MKAERFIIRTTEGRRRYVSQGEGLTLVTGKLARWEPSLVTQMKRRAEREAKVAEPIDPESE